MMLLVRNLHKQVCLIDDCILALTLCSLAIESVLLVCEAHCLIMSQIGNCMLTILRVYYYFLKGILLLLLSKGVISDLNNIKLD